MSGRSFHLSNISLITFTPGSTKWTLVLPNADTPADAITDWLKVDAYVRVDWLEIAS